MICLLGNIFVPINLFNSGNLVKAWQLGFNGDEYFFPDLVGNRILRRRAVNLISLRINFSEGSSEISSDEEFFGHHITITKTIELNSPDSIAEAILPLVSIQSPDRNVDIKRHPSPYYYADLYKNREEECSLKLEPPKFKKTIAKTINRESDEETHQKFDNQKTKPSNRRYRKSSSLDNPNLDKPIRASKSSQLRYKKSSSVDAGGRSSCRDVPSEAVMPPNRLTSTCACFTPDDDLDDEMSRQRHVYETAFDCRISKSDDDLDNIDKVSNHPVLFQEHPEKNAREDNSTNSQGKRKVTLVCPPSQDNISRLSQNLQDMHLPLDETSGPSGVLPLRGYTPSPPSTAPLPTKFHGKESVMNSIRSAPNLPHPKGRLKELHLPIKSLRGRSPTSSSGGSAFDIEFGNSQEIISDFKRRVRQSKEPSPRDLVMEIKDRPRKDLLVLKCKKETNEHILEFKGRRRRHKYSSTESMTTSSSGGSMESIKSSTSEGNRSTTSSESRHSSSLSSHSSDSVGSSAFPTLQTSILLAHSNKLHILSPISDKSSQEPISETSDNNRNNNSQKCSPEEAATPENVKIKRRLPQNRNLLNLGFHQGDKEIQGSDSGISIQSREGIKSRLGLTSAELSAPSHQDFSDLPFDMPKLRRRRMVAQDACTSSSATSVDLKDLPFDMPKLRRRLRVQQPNMESSMSQASSSQSVVEADRQG